MPLSGLEFSCDVTSGEVASGGSVGATVTYSPIVADNASVQYLSLKCRGTLNETLLKLTGSCVGEGHIMVHTYPTYGFERNFSFRFLF